MPDLPSGEVTLLFSDIEGSTNLLARLGRDYADALDTQRRLLREAWSTWGGIEMGTEGDSFYVVFADATDAVAAAAQGQRMLAEASWPGGENVRVRIGAHTGTPDLHDGAYVGMDVHLAARVAGVAHGGQTLISATDCRSLGIGPPERGGIARLGRHTVSRTSPTANESSRSLFDGLQPGLPAAQDDQCVHEPPVTRDRAGRTRPRMPRKSGQRIVAVGTASIVTLTGPGGDGQDATLDRDCTAVRRSTLSTECTSWR